MILAALPHGMLGLSGYERLDYPGCLYTQVYCSCSTIHLPHCGTAM